MTSEQIVNQVMAERRIGKEDFFRSHRHVRARLTAIDRLRQAGFSKAEIAKAIRKSPSALGYWLNGESPRWRSIVGRGQEDGSLSIALQVCHDLKIYRAEFFGKGRDARLVEARREAIRRLRAAGFCNAGIARVLKRSASTIQYWTNPSIREKKRLRAIEYVAQWEARA